jgi:hypothetical protein
MPVKKGKDEVDCDRAGRGAGGKSRWKGLRFMGPFLNSLLSKDVGIKSSCQI